MSIAIPPLSNYRFLITGGAGFIGSNLVEYLVKAGAKVVVIDNLLTGKKQNIKKYLSKIDFVQGDILDFSIVKEITRDIDFILHQAALGSVPRSIKNPDRTLSINITGTLNILKAAVKNKVKRVVIASSSSVYGDRRCNLKSEDLYPLPLSPYAVSKISSEMLAQCFWRLYKLETVILRYFNVFGERQDAHSQYAAVIPIFINSLLDGKSPIIYGDGTQSRDFTYVKNVVNANILACFSSVSTCGKVFNIAGGNKITINQLYTTLQKIIGTKIPPVYKPFRKGDIMHSSANITKAKKYLSYFPSYTFEEGLRLTVEWYKIERGKT